MTHEDVPGVVIEPGTRTTRVGVSGDVAPAVVVDSVVKVTNGEFGFEIPVAGHVDPTAEILAPVAEGVVVDLDAATALWQHLAKTKLGMEFNEQPLTITEEVWVPAQLRAQLAERVFEGLEVPLFQLVKGPLAATFEAARSTALVVSAGAGAVSAVPVIDGVARSKAATKTPFAGDFVDAHILQQLAHARERMVPYYLAQHGVKGTDSMYAYQLSRLVGDFKRICCVASSAPLRAPEIKHTKQYEFPTRFSLLVGPERTVSVEPLFQPTMSPLPDGPPPELNSLGLSEVVYQTLQKVDAPPEVVDNLLSNIVFHGGTAHLPGVVQRLHADLINMMPNMTPNVYLQSGHPVWVGASVLASLNEFDESSWVTRMQYDEQGASRLFA